MNRRSIALFFIFTVGVIHQAGVALAGEPAVYSHKGLAIRGYDPVAYFQDGAPARGDERFRLEWNGAIWLFASAANLERFKKAPETYAPEYGGYCAYAVSQGSTASIDPEVWTIVGDKLYLNYSKRIGAKWLKNRDGYIAAADKNWPGVLD